MMLITLTITAFAIPKISWHELPSRIGHLSHPPGEMWIAFVSIVLALSGVEAIANLTGVMKRPVAHTARKAIWVVTAEVAIFNVVLAIAMLAIFPLDRDATSTTCSPSSPANTSADGANGASAYSAACCSSPPPTPPSPT